MGKIPPLPTTMVLSPDMAPMVAAANSIKDGTGSPLEAATVLRAVRHRRDILSSLLLLPTNSELALRTLRLINLEDGPFQMVVTGEVRLDYAIVVGRLVDQASHESQRHFELLALSAKTKPEDEINAEFFRQKLIEVRARAVSRSLPDHASAESRLQSDLLALLTEIKPEDEAKGEAILRVAIKIHAELMGEELKCQNSEWIFQQSYWRVGNVLSWIAVRDVKLLCKILDFADWRQAVTYGDNGLTWKVADPGGELIGALQDGRLRSSRQKNRESPEDLRANFWARKSISDLFAIDPDFERSKVLELWKAETDQVEGMPPHEQSADLADVIDSTAQAVPKAVTDVVATQEATEENVQGGAGPGTSAEISASLELDRRVAQIEQQLSKPRNPGGRPLTYDWPALVPVLEEHVRQFGMFLIKARFINWCREKTSGHWGSPDDKTIRDAIKKYGLEKIGYRGNRGK